MENKGGIGFGTLLQVAFIVLKLCGVVTWPWMLVLLPIEIGVTIAIIAIVCVLVAIFKK